MATVHKVSENVNDRLATKERSWYLGIRNDSGEIIVLFFCSCLVSPYLQNPMATVTGSFTREMERNGPWKVPRKVLGTMRNREKKVNIRDMNIT